MRERARPYYYSAVIVTIEDAVPIRRARELQGERFAYCALLTQGAI